MSFPGGRMNSVRGSCLSPLSRDMYLDFFLRIIFDA